MFGFLAMQLNLGLEHWAQANHTRDLLLLHFDPCLVSCLALSLDLEVVLFSINLALVETQQSHCVKSLLSPVS